jgi:aspartate racemase
MKTLGIVGGIGPESTIQYYRSIIAAYRDRTGNNSYPPVIINSIDVTKMLGLIGAGQLAEVTEYLSSAVNKLARAGAEFGLLAANTPHIVFDEIQQQSSIPLISIVEATCETVKALNLTRVGLIGTRFTMQSDFYPKVLNREGIDLVVPELNDQNFIHDKYMAELVPGKFLDETRDRILMIVDRMIGQQNIQGLILGGTELPLLLREATYHGLPFLDTTKIHVERAVEQMLSQ